MNLNDAAPGSLAENYERYLGPLFFEPYAQNLAKRIAQSVDSVLELACGTGRLTKYLLEKLSDNSEIIATDLNSDMLDVAKTVINDPRVKWQLADAQNLPFQEKTFDLVACQFGFMFFADKRKALSEVYRVLKRNGTFLFNTWDEVKYNAISCITEEVFTEIYGDESPSFSTRGPYSYFNVDEIFNQCQQAGFSDIKFDIVSIVSEGAAADNIIKGLVHGSPLTKYILERDFSIENIERKLHAKLSAYFNSSKNTHSMQALVFTGIK